MLGTAAGAKTGTRVERDRVQRHRAREAPAAAPSVLIFDLGEQQASDTSPLPIAFHEQGAQSPGGGIELPESDRRLHLRRHD